MDMNNTTAEKKDWKLTPMGIIKKGEEMGIYKTRWEKTNQFKRRLIGLGANK